MSCQIQQAIDASIITKEPVYLRGASSGELIELGIKCASQVAIVSGHGPGVHIDSYDFLGNNWKITVWL